MARCLLKMSDHISISNSALYGAVADQEITKQQAEKIFSRMQIAFHEYRVNEKSPQRSKHDPAVPIDESVFDNKIICLEDGRPFRSLKRHLNETYGLNEHQYRAKWNLPSTYPMACKELRERRRKNAKKNKFGQKN